MPPGSVSLWPQVRAGVEAAGIRLRPWQELVAERALAAVDGRLAFRTVAVSTPRQAGKSWLIQAMAIARAANPDLFGGEPQTVVHVANKHLAARRIHSLAWGWAGKAGLEVRTAQGMERIIWPDGSSWDALTLSSVYGASSSLVMLDEVWDVTPEEYREGIRPTQLARREPQLWALSTAHRRASGLMVQIMEDGRAGVGRTMLADWGAPEGADYADPAVWRAASPWWDGQRAEEMALAHRSEGFAEQLLNVWPAAAAGWIGTAAWQARAVEVPPGQRWLAAGVNTPVGDEVAPVVALAGRRGSGWLVRAVQCADMAEAAALVRRVPSLVVGKSLEDDPVWRGRRLETGPEQTVRTLTEFLRQVSEAGLVHDGGELLSGQVAGVRLGSSPGGGARLVAKGRVDAVKAACWAVAAARAARPATIVVLDGGAA
jgi:hypothetical protein